MIFEKQIVGAFRGMMYTRCDDTETVHYFSSDDFPLMRKEAIDFTSSMGHKLRGYLYQYDSANENRLIVFDHGFGGGHRAYMREIDMLCRHGYRVFAYDHTGCMESGGRTPNGLAQSLCDLNDCISMLKADERFSGNVISVMGHSWGAFSAMNIPTLHPDIAHVVGLSGFVSVEMMVGTFFPGILKGYRGAVLSLEKESNPSFVDYSAIDSLRGSKAQALLIYSKNDKICKSVHYKALATELDDAENVKLMLVEGKGHNPNYSDDAVSYLASFSKDRGKLLRNKKASPEDKKAFVASYDWWRMTEQDEKVWKVIFDHLDTV